MTSQINPLSADEIEILLDEYLETDINCLNTVPISAALAEYPRSKQDRALHWINADSSVKHGSMNSSFECHY